VILVDTSVILDVVQDDAKWGSWSLAAIESAAAKDALSINDIVYAELSVGYSKIELLDDMIADWALYIAPIPRTALFLAANVFRHYRQQRGAKTGVLPDFFIGAHAAILDTALLTRDIQRVRTYFPTVKLIAPA
jgi:predicted nucleic acid-binding protein